MSAASQIIRAIEANGGRVRADGDTLVIIPKDAAASVIDDLRRYKPELLAELARRNADRLNPALPIHGTDTLAPVDIAPGYRIVGQELKPPPIRLSDCSVVTDTAKFVAVTVRQLGHQLAGRTWLAGNWGLQGLLDRLAACGCVVEVEDEKGKK
jgi:hypothetical protein